MKLSFKALLTALAVVALAALLLVPIAGAGPSGMMGDGDHDGDHSGDWCGGGVWNGDGHWGGTGMWGTASGAAWLTSNPDALAAWTQLRVDHQQAMQAWHETYKADLKSAAAQQALHDLWTARWNDMKAFYEQYGAGATWTCPSDGMWGGWQGGGMMGGHQWDASHMWGTGHGAAWMANHPRAFGRWLDMRAEQTVHVDRWAERYHERLKSDAAQTALKTMRAHHRAQVKAFYTKHHLSVTTPRLRDGAGGWMGLGGMWGGFGW